VRARARATRQQPSDPAASNVSRPGGPSVRAHRRASRRRGLERGAQLSVRQSTVERTTNETRILLRLALDGGLVAIDTEVRFLNHMLEAFAKHSGCGLEIEARGDGMDHHHLIEDVGIALGRAIYEALGEKRGIARFGSMLVPLDDALIACAVDLSGRSYLNFDVRFTVEDLADLKTEMIREFFRAVADNGRFNLHLVQMNGDVAHHLCEASFKAFAKAFQQAKTLTGSDEILSTKGLLE
jgi:imidazoleglycerol-phosphate dehydratase